MLSSRMRFLLTSSGGLLVGGLVVYLWAQSEGPVTGSQYPEIETQLTPLAAPLPKPGPGDWLANHHEDGQTFEQYLAAKPVRKSDRLTTIYICLIGEFTPKQRAVLTATKKYLGVLYAAPVKERKTVALADIPPRGERKDEARHQILTTYVLGEVLAPNRPQDALAYLAFTAADLYPGEGWNFVYGQATLDQRVGVWSIHRNGDPAESEAAYRLCLLRTMKIAGHETGHILTMQHCIAHHCGMNGCNNRSEADRAPLSFCPVCFRKLCWNLQVDPKTHLTNLAQFCADEKFPDQAESFQKQLAALAK